MKPQLEQYESGLIKGGDVTSFRSEPTVNLSTTSFYNKPKYKVNSKSMVMWEHTHPKLGTDYIGMYHEPKLGRC